MGCQGMGWLALLLLGSCLGCEKVPPPEGSTHAKPAATVPSDESPSP